MNRYILIPASIVHTGNVGVNKLTDYSASKFCAVGFEEALRLELFANNYDGVKSTIVSPW